MAEGQSPGRRIAGLNVFPGVSGMHLSTFYLSCCLSIMLATFLPQSQAYLLAVHLQIPESEQGMVSGNLNFWGEIVIICTVGLFGALSDKVGRRPVIAFGFAVMAIGFYLYPRAVQVNELLFFRVIYSVGIAAVSCMLVAILADYVRDESRGKGSGYLGVMNGLGAMIAALVLIKLPAIFVNRGMTPVEAGGAAYMIVVGIAAFAALSMWFGLKKKDVVATDQRPSLLVGLREGVLAAKDPGIAVAYAASFVARGNLVVVGTFLALWLTTYGTSQLGMSAADALAKGAGVIAISYAAALLGAPLIGLLTDKIPRKHALSLTLLVGFLGYGGTIFVTNPFSGLMIFFAVIIGLSEVGCIITSGVLIAQQTPERIRGSVFGMFNLTGAIGILVASKVGGYLFDHWQSSGPFVFFGLVSLTVLLVTLAVSRKIQPLEKQEGEKQASENRS